MLRRAPLRRHKALSLRRQTEAKPHFLFLIMLRAPHLQVRLTEVLLFVVLNVFNLFLAQLDMTDYAEVFEGIIPASRLFFRGRCSITHEAELRLEVDILCKLPIYARLIDLPALPFVVGLLLARPFRFELLILAPEHFLVGFHAKALRPLVHEP